MRCRRTPRSTSFYVEQRSNFAKACSRSCNGLSNTGVCYAKHTTPEPRASHSAKQVTGKGLLFCSGQFMHAAALCGCKPLASGDVARITNLCGFLPAWQPHNNKFQTETASFMTFKDAHSLTNLPEIIAGTVITTVPFI
jgi:hypothetical protein